MALKKIATGYKVTFWVIILLALDQLVKLLVHHNLEVGESIEVFKWFNLCYVENPGFAFGMELGGGNIGKIILSCFRLVMIAALCYGIHYLIQKGDEGVFRSVVELLSTGSFKEDLLQVLVRNLILELFVVLPDGFVVRLKNTVNAANHHER